MVCAKTWKWIFKKTFNKIFMPLGRLQSRTQASHALQRAIASPRKNPLPAQKQQHDYGDCAAADCGAIPIKEESSFFYSPGGL